MIVCQFWGGMAEALPAQSNPELLNFPIILDQLWTLYLRYLEGQLNPMVREEGNAEFKLPPFDYILADKTKKILSILKDRATEDMHMMKHRTVAYTHKE